MPFRTQAVAQASLNGRPYTIVAIDNPTIDDVLIVEMRLHAAEVMNGVENTGHRVALDVRDVLIRLGVER